MADITSIAETFFDACETGQGWGGCSAFEPAIATAEHQRLQPAKAGANGSFS